MSECGRVNAADKRLQKVSEFGRNKAALVSCTAAQMMTLVSSKQQNREAWVQQEPESTRRANWLAEACTRQPRKNRNVDGNWSYVAVAITISSDLCEAGGASQGKGARGLKNIVARTRDVRVGYNKAGLQG